jgi:hypothetical protein
LILLPADAAERRAISEFLEATAAATGKLKVEGQRRLSEVLQLLAADTGRRSARRGGTQVAAG